MQIGAACEQGGRYTDVSWPLGVATSMHLCVCMCVYMCARACDMLNKQASLLTFACELLLPQAHRISDWK